MLSCLWLAEYFIAVCLISDLRWFAVMPGYVQHFTHAGNDKMKCRYCQEDIKFTNSHLHSSNLRNHLTFKHPEKLSVPEKAKVPKTDDYFTGHKSSVPSLRDWGLRLRMSRTSGNQWSQPTFESTRHLPILSWKLLFPRPASKGPSHVTSCSTLTYVQTWKLKSLTSSCFWGITSKIW